jgi:hypothetical protein
MADVTHSDDPTDTPVLTDLLLGLGNGPDNENYLISAVKTLIQEQVQLKTSAGASYSVGQLSYDPESKTGLMDTGYTGVRVNIGQEIHIPFYNNTGDTILNGTVMNATGVEPSSGLFYGIKADASSPATSSSVIGLATADVLDGEIGLATRIGIIHDMDTSGLSVGGLVYLSETAGLMTNTRPQYPANIVIMGSTLVVDPTLGHFFSSPSTFVRLPGSRSYFFTSNGATASTVFIAGSYEFETGATTLTQASATKTFGDANSASGSHAFVVCGGVGTVVGGGQVGLRVNGDSFADDGTHTIGDTEILIEDIEDVSVALDAYFETTKNWAGIITYELYVVSGSPSAYSLEFNLGESAYIDAGNRDFTIRDIRVEGLCKSSDDGVNVELMAHHPVGWTFDDGAFEAGDGILADFAAEMAPNNELITGKHFKWKRVGLNEFLEGGGSEGYLIRVTTTNNNAIQDMTAHVGGVLEELSL